MAFPCEGQRRSNPIPILNETKKNEQKETTIDRAKAVHYIAVCAVLTDQIFRCVQFCGRHVEMTFLSQFETKDKWFVFLSMLVFTQLRCFLGEL